MPDHTQQVSYARDFAVRAHGGQKYGERPYVWHLDAVAAQLAPFGAQAQVLGYLHDVVEDTDVPLAEIEATFGAHTAACVALLTDVPGATRRERKAKTYAKLAAVGPDLELALIAKAADRLANLSACVADGRAELWDTYHGEHPAFRAAAYRPGLCDSLWAAMDEQLRARPAAR